MTAREPVGTPPAHEGAGVTAAGPDSGESPQGTPGDDDAPRPGVPRPAGAGSPPAAAVPSAAPGGGTGDGAVLPRDGEDGLPDHGGGPATGHAGIPAAYADVIDAPDDGDGDDGDDGFGAAGADHYESGWDDRPVSPRVDNVVALVVLVLDAAVLRFAVFLLYLHGDHYRDVVAAAPTYVHRAPLVAFGACALLMALGAAGLARLRMPVATGMQIVLTALVCFGLLAYAVDQMHREVEAPTPVTTVPASTPYVPPCYSGSGTCVGG